MWTNCIIIIRIPHFVSMQYKCDPWNQDTSLIRTLFQGPRFGGSTHAHQQCYKQPHLIFLNVLLLLGRSGDDSLEGSLAAPESQPAATGPSSSLCSTLSLSDEHNLLDTAILLGSKSDISSFSSTEQGNSQIVLFSNPQGAEPGVAMEMEPGNDPYSSSAARKGLEVQNAHSGTHQVNVAMDLGPGTTLSGQ